MLIIFLWGGALFFALYFLLLLPFKVWIEKENVEPFFKKKKYTKLKKKRQRKGNIRNI